MSARTMRSPSMAASQVLPTTAHGRVPGETAFTHRRPCPALCTSDAVTGEFRCFRRTSFSQVHLRSAAYLMAISWRAHGSWRRSALDSQADRERSASPNPVLVLPESMIEDL